ncbi:MAG: mechanosensitive ion channel family protein [Hyperthermus sp.]|nr:MAG: mechanosensitive ion channel family protein [Hyperthermus sp.]
MGRLGHLFYSGLVFVAVMAASIVVAMFVRRMIRRVFWQGQAPTALGDIVGKTVYYSIIIVSSIIAMGLAGIDVTGFAFAGSIIGVALGFAAQTVASNFFSGLFLYIDKPLQPGAMVELPGLGVIGRVTEITVFSTRIETIDGRVLRIPNEDIFKSTIVNLERTVARRLEYRIGISYSSSIELAVSTVRRVLDEHPLVLAEPEPVVYVDRLGDSAVELVALFWVPSWRWLEVQRALLGKIKVELEKEGVEIPFPQRVVWLRGIRGGEERVDGTVGGIALGGHVGEDVMEAAEKGLEA